MSATVKLTIPAKADYLVLCRLVLSGIAMQTRMSEIELADLKLAVTEVCGNAVQHAVTGAPGVVRVVYRVEPDAIEVSVEDDGAGPAFPDVDEAALMEGPVESGMGLAIVRAVMDEVVLEDGASAAGHRRPHAQAARRLASELRVASSRLGETSSAATRFVISKIRRAVESGSTVRSSPPPSRTRRSSPTMAPRTVESRNDTAVRSRTTSAGLVSSTVSNVRRSSGASIRVELPGERDDRAVRQRLDMWLRGRHRGMMPWKRERRGRAKRRPRQTSSALDDPLGGAVVHDRSRGGSRRSRPSSTRTSAR